MARKKKMQPGWNHVTDEDGNTTKVWVQGLLNPIAIGEQHYDAIGIRHGSPADRLPVILDKYRGKLEREGDAMYPEQRDGWLAVCDQLEQEIERRAA